MCRLQIASSAQVQAIYRESHAVWGSALSPRDYVGLWADVSRTAWARQHARFLVWTDRGGQVLSSMKVYRPLIRIDGETSRSAVLGAIFTPRALRRRGHAAAMMSEVLGRSSDEGARVAMLFSDIGLAYYSSLGFRPLPAEEHWGSLRRAGAGISPGGTLRRMQPEDVEMVRRAHRDSTATRRLAVVRDDDHWDYLWARSRSFFRRLRDPQVRQRWHVAELDGTVGYLVTVEGRGEWNVREVAALGGDAHHMALILRLGAATARRANLRRFYGWLPREVLVHLEDWTIRSQPRRRAVPMILPHDDHIDLRALDSWRSAYIPFHDQF